MHAGSLPLTCLVPRPRLSLSLVLSLLTLAPTLRADELARGVTLRTRPTDFHLRRGPVGPELVVAHALPGYVSIRPAPGSPASWPVQRHALEPLPAHYAGTVRACSEDLDGDGDLDLVVVRRRAFGGSLPGDTTVVVMWEEGRDATGAPRLTLEHFAGPPGPVELCLADLDGDGRQDLVVATVAHRIYAMRGTPGVAGGRPGFDAPVALGPQVAFPFGLQVSDLDGDARPEIVFMSRHFGTSGAWLLWNDSTPGSLAVTHERVTDEVPLSAVIADVDDDGRNEVVLSRAAQPTWVYDFSPGGLAGRLLPPVSVEALRGAAELRALHLDGDGHLDFVYTDVQARTVQVVHGQAWPNLRRGPTLELDRVTLLDVAAPRAPGEREIWLGADLSRELVAWRF